MAVLTTMAMTLVGLAAAGIYPDGHFDYVTKVTDESQFTDLIKQEVDAGKTLFVRWIASEGWGWWKKQAPAWNAIANKYQDNNNVAFADINLRDAPIRGDYNPGAGGWPTIRYFNSGTGYGGEPYPKKTDKAMCDELGDEEYMEAYVMEQGGVFPCSIEDGEGCTEKEKKYIKKWKETKSAADVASQLERLAGMQAGKMKPSLMKWIKQRIGILKQLDDSSTEKTEDSPSHEEL